MREQPMRFGAPLSHQLVLLTIVATVGVGLPVAVNMVRGHVALKPFELVRRSFELSLIQLR